MARGPLQKLNSSYSATATKEKKPDSKPKSIGDLPEAHDDSEAMDFVPLYRLDSDLCGCPDLPYNCTIYGARHNGG